MKGIVALPCNAIPLVPDEHDDHVGVGVLPRVLEPRGQVVERVPPRDVVDQEGARSAAVVRARDGAERLLAGLWGHERRIDMRPACLLTRSSLQTQRMETKQLLPRSDAFMDLLVTSHALMANGIRQWKCNRGKK